MSQDQTPAWCDRTDSDIKARFDKAHELLAQIAELWIDHSDDVYALHLEFHTLGQEEPPITLVERPRRILFEKLVNDGMSICEASKRAGTRHGCNVHDFWTGEAI